MTSFVRSQKMSLQTLMNSLPILPPRLMIDLTIYFMRIRNVTEYDYLLIFFSKETKTFLFDPEKHLTTCQWCAIKRENLLRWTDT